MIDYQAFPHGTASFADPHMIARAGLYRAKNGLYLGHDETGRALYSDQQAAVLLVGGARSGKGDHIIPWLVDGHYGDHIISMDWKSQNGAIAQLQVLQGRRVINWNPRGNGGVPSHRINPTSYLRGNSPTLIPDAKLFAASFLTLTGGANAKFFEETGQRWIEAVAVTLGRLAGVVTLPVLADLMNQIGLLSDDWLSFERHMAAMPEVSIRSVVEELKQARESDNPNAGGVSGVKAETKRAFSGLSDPQLRDAVSAPFDFDFEELTKPGCNPYLVNIMEAQEYAETSGPVIRSVYSGALVAKRRAIGARRQLWLCDEIGNIGAWPMAIGLATFGAGYGIRPVFVVQSAAQLAGLGKNAEKIIPNSCGTQIFKGIRDIREAKAVSEALGTQTITLEDFQTNERAKLENEQALLEVVSGRLDPMEAGFAMAQRDASLAHRIKTPRPLATGDEIVNRPNGRAFVFMPGVLERPADLTIENYWKRRDLAGRYLGDPYHSPDGKVEVGTAFGQRFKPVITEPVPDPFADWPQYRASGTWSYLKGYRPL
ncbi:type IV secretory system conjugative DNA transfer family protein [Martelella radicis]|uniref:Type IV secretion system protein VirD4 n=1 Tax=Martelella radicis TaxID=1397476 RepID=A0A7W6KMK4_9HYPH|nr:type IV secretory system conjugative DNA transfer family protein [Martelella radicis]MBB4123962.1 type IV secretion system protein VirD4 [Martelella radicis]